jgi:hypothetical protein
MGRILAYRGTVHATSMERAQVLSKWIMHEKSLIEYIDMKWFISLPFNQYLSFWFLLRGERFLAPPVISKPA